MTRKMLDDTQLDRLLQAQLPEPPQVPASLRQRVRERTTQAATAAERARAIAVLKARQQTELLRARQRLGRDLLVWLLLGGAALALLPALARGLAPAFQNLHFGSIDGFSLALALAAVLGGMAAGFPRQARTLLGL